MLLLANPNVANNETSFSPFLIRLVFNVHGDRSGAVGAGGWPYERESR
jgi:hypothetical protein